jgi:iron(III) transport system permease protein
LLLVLSPHIGLSLLSFGTIWSFSVLPDAYTWDHYLEVFRSASSYITNTLLYAGLAALADVLLGTAIAYIVWRTRLAGRRFLDYAATASLAIPGVVLGIGYLRAFHDLDVPLVGKPLASWWVIIVVALLIRRLPYALRACTAALQQLSVSLEEAAENLGATKGRTVWRIVVPLMSGGILAGFITSFATAAVELSATIMLVSEASDAPLSYGIYEFMQSAAGRGPGAALGMVAVLIVGLGTYVSHRIIERGRRRYAADRLAAGAQH